MKPAILAACLCLVAAPAMAEPVSWYVAHPRETRRMMRVCGNDPGHAKGTPDCENAFQASIELHIAEGRAATGFDGTPPTAPRYWKMHPDLLQRQEWVCSLVPHDPEYRLHNYCSAVEEAVRK